MYLKNISLVNFKNYEELELEFCPKINCIVGDNGVGKTNILDGIHYLSLTKSFFNTIDSINIRHGEDYFIVQGTFVNSGGEDKIYCAFQRQRQKVFKRNGKEYQRLSDHIGRFPAVMISPADSALITEGSEERRKFMNKIISQYNPEYLDAVINYNKVLQQRNRLLKDLKDGGRFEEDAIAVWNDQLVRYGNIIFRERENLINELVPVFQEYYNMISSEREKVKLKYKSHLNDESFAESLRASFLKDRILEYTTVGVHKDDLVFEMNDSPVKLLGSQGQQKSYIVALKLAKFEYIKQKAGFPPVLLLDDIFDKFDHERVKQIIFLVGNHRFGQIFITDTDQERMQKILAGLNTGFRLVTIGHRGEMNVKINQTTVNEKE